MENIREKHKMSKLRKGQLHIFIFRLIIFTSVVVLFILSLFGNAWANKQFEVLIGFNFFKQFSVLHILWVIWLYCMLCQIIPLPGKFRLINKISIGSQKLFKTHYKEAPNRPSRKELMKEYWKMTKRGLVLLAVWVSAIAIISGVKLFLEFKFPEQSFLLNKCLFMITMTFYACDLICGLFWCPFRTFFMKHRCCVNCRIFNWDHMMMFTPMSALPSFYSWSLLGLGLFVMFLWELMLLIHPERFFESSNANIKCANCTDLRCRKFGGIHGLPHRNANK